ncbi:unnamed protein product [Amoebophrya sp. A25]|nr:unnamed protein product [Amoebophrya sp. A25]|eukprot:GSA25T00007440001.1
MLAVTTKNLSRNAGTRSVSSSVALRTSSWLTSALRPRSSCALGSCSSTSLGSGLRIEIEEWGKKTQRISAPSRISSLDGNGRLGGLTQFQSSRAFSSSGDGEDGKNKPGDDGASTSPSPEEITPSKAGETQQTSAAENSASSEQQAPTASTPEPPEGSAVEEDASEEPYWRRSNAPRRRDSSRGGWFDVADAKFGGGMSRQSSEKSLSPVGEPPKLQSIFSIPISRKPLLPGQLMPIWIKNQKVVNEVNRLIQSQTPYLGLFLRKDDDAGTSSASGDEEIVTATSQLYNIGTLASIQQVVPLQATGGLQIHVTGHRRVTLKQVESFGPPMVTNVAHWSKNAEHARGEDESEARALVQETVKLIQDIFRLNPQFREFLEYAMRSPTFKIDHQNPGRLADFGTTMLSASKEETMEVFQEVNGFKRLQLAYALLQKERQVLEAQVRIRSSVEETVQKQQKEFYLREQMKVIKKELGLEKDDRDALVHKFKTRIEKEIKGEIPTEVKEVLDQEMEKLQYLDKNSSEFQVARNYLDWLTALPYGAQSEENFNLKKARHVLDRDHYGLTDVKERILEFIGVGKLKGSVQGKIICLVGPPGTGKTSIGKSIAESLNREFFRFSVGGLHDVAEIKGHRRTYIGAMPGKLIQCLKQTKVNNPLILIDEIDKLGRGGMHGDPASALLEVLDPSQNKGFVDHFLDVPVDFSQVLFLCTANVLDTIPEPLLDRMEVVRLSGYDLPEKTRIAQDYLIPKVMEQSGLIGVDEKSFIGDDAIDSMIRWYCREAGVRNLQKQIEKLCRKRAFQRAEIKDQAEQEKEEKEKAEKEKEGKEATTEADDASSSSTATDDASSTTTTSESTTSESPSSSSTPSSATGARPAVDTDKQDEQVASTETTGETQDTPSSEASSSSTKGDSSSSKGDSKKPEDPLPQITADNLADYLGKQLYTSDKLFADQPPAGVVMGLAWTSLGGSTLYIETKAIETSLPGQATDSGGRGTLNVTGRLGDVMQESTKISMVVAKKFHPAVVSFARRHDIFLHVPEGATPKDGPSAGVTMTTALISLALDKPVLPDVAMTGEVSLTGMVLAVGGIKEKTIAARRSSCTTLIFPDGNKRDVDALPSYLKEGIAIHYAKTYEDVWRVAFGETELPAAQTATESTTTTTTSTSSADSTSTTAAAAATTSGAGA